MSTRQHPKCNGAPRLPGGEAYHLSDGARRPGLASTQGCLPNAAPPLFTRLFLTCGSALTPLALGQTERGALCLLDNAWLRVPIWLIAMNAYIDFLFLVGLMTTEQFR